MSGILRSLKSDLLDRRLLPILVLLGLALAGAIAYVVLAGGGSAASQLAAAPRESAPSATGQSPALPVTQAPADPHAAVAETTDGARYQHKSGSHNPFAPLPVPASSTKTAGTSTAQSTAVSGGGSSSSSSPGSSTTPSESKASPPSTPSESSSTPVKPVKPKPKPKPAYVVTVQFGLMPASAEALAQLTSYEDLKPSEQLPSAKDPRIVFAGAKGNGKGARFTLGREAILKGQGTCLPSAAQCEAVELAVGQSEELDYLEPSGQTVPWELKVVSIAKRGSATASAARRHRHRHHRRDY